MHIIVVCKTFSAMKCGWLAAAAKLWPSLAQIPDWLPHNYFIFVLILIWLLFVVPHHPPIFPFRWLKHHFFSFSLTIPLVHLAPASLLLYTHSRLPPTSTYTAISVTPPPPPIHHTTTTTTISNASLSLCLHHHLPPTLSLITISHQPSLHLSPYLCHTNTL